jgi:hypothetical protein
MPMASRTFVEQLSASTIGAQGSPGVTTYRALREDESSRCVDRPNRIGVSSAGNSRTFAGPPVRDRQVALLLKG